MHAFNLLQIVWIALLVSMVAGCASRRARPPKLEEKLTQPSSENLKLPPMNRKVKEYVETLERELEIPESGTSWEKVYAHLGKLLDIKKEEGLSGAQFAEQLFLATFYDRTSKGAFLGIFLISATRIDTKEISTSDWLEALAPYLEGTDEDRWVVRNRAFEMLQFSFAILPAMRGGERERESIYNLESYLDNTTPEKHPGFIKECLFLEPTATFNTLLQVYVSSNERSDVFRQRSELNLALASLDLAKQTSKGAKGERVDAADRDVLMKLTAMSTSPHWCVRAYVAAMFWYPPFKTDKALLEKLAKDQHPVVACVAQGVLDKK